MVDDVSLTMIDDTIASQLGAAIWSWEASAAHSDVKCPASDCFCHRSHKLARYSQLYAGTVLGYAEQSKRACTIFETRSHLLQAIVELRSDLNVTRDDYYSKLVRLRGSDRTAVDEVELLNATALVVKLLTTLDCVASQQPWHRLESKPVRRAIWHDSIPFSKYIQDSFTISNHHILSHSGSNLHIEMKSKLKAYQLQRMLGITFRPTHDIRSHLHFDRKSNVVEIFHHVAFIKEHLRCSKVSCQNSIEDQSEPLPRQLLLEVLDSIQVILFPLSHARSKRLLQSLIHTHSLDPEIANFEFSAIRNPGEEEIAYVYLADRLSDLYNETQNPRPRGWIEKQMEMRSGARYMMLATLIGVLFAVLLGFLALAVSCLQTWIAWQAWKYPVPQPSA